MTEMTGIIRMTGMIRDDWDNWVTREDLDDWVDRQRVRENSFFHLSLG